MGRNSNVSHCFFSFFVFVACVSLCVAILSRIHAATIPFVCCFMERHRLFRCASIVSPYCLITGPKACFCQQTILSVLYVCVFVCGSLSILRCRPRFLLLIFCCLVFLFLSLFFFCPGIMKHIRNFQSNAYIKIRAKHTARGYVTTNCVIKQFLRKNKRKTTTMKPLAVI